jgi:hypothetical protein
MTKTLLLAPILMLHTSVAHASSVAATTLDLRGAVARAARIVVGQVTGTPAATIEGKSFASVEIAVERTLKGANGRPGETLRVFDPGAWFQHTHAAAIKGGVVSYEDPRYATPVPAGEIKKGARLLVFLRADAPPAGFPANAVFALCGGAYERAARAKEITDLKVAAFGGPITLKVGERVVFPDGLELELKAHAHKHQRTGGPSKEMSEVQATIGKVSDLLTLGHTVQYKNDGGRPDEEWETKSWQRYRIELLQMSYDQESTVRVRMK